MADKVGYSKDNGPTQGRDADIEKLKEDYHVLKKAFEAMSQASSYGNMITHGFEELLEKLSPLSNLENFVQKREQMSKFTMDALRGIRNALSQPTYAEWPQDAPTYDGTSTIFRRTAK